MELPLPDAERLITVQHTLLQWYARCARDLPWRRTRDPYAILLSEIMLQQTQVDRVHPKFQEFLDAFPTFSALAAAPLAEVIRRWAPLGYNRRAVRLHQIARIVMQELGGRLPEQARALRELEGLGSYTANAVACFAFGQRGAVVDSNVRRVLGRVFADVIGLDPPPGRVLDRFAQAVLPIDNAYDWNQAIMDLGATVCIARAPACSRCPLAFVCVGRPLMARAPKRLPRVAEGVSTYTTGAPFEHSRRYYRGRIVNRLRALASGASLSFEELGQGLRDDFGPEDHAWLANLVDALQHDGLAAVEAAADGPRVRLP